MTLLEGIPFGRHYFEVAMILRESTCEQHAL